jgi:lipopolysaccharide transport system permease protein
MVVNLGLAMGIGLILAVFDVFVRDIGHFWQVIVQFWFWLTPIVYVADVLPPVVRSVLKYNPMYWLSNSYQQVVAYGNVPDLQPIAVIAVVMLLLLSFGFVLFIRASGDIVDAL